jgi:hypothetical protein
MCASITERTGRGCQPALLAEDPHDNNAMFDNVYTGPYKLCILTIIHTQLNDWPVMMIIMMMMMMMTTTTTHCRHRPNYFLC